MNPEISAHEAEQFRELADKHKIAELLYTYCRAVDRIDRALGYSIWNDDATVDYGPAIFMGSGKGVIDYICDSHLHGTAHSHQIANILIWLNGDKAVSEAYVNSAMRMVRDDQLVQVNTRGRYLDHWSKREGRWGIDRRTFVNDFDEARPATPGSIPPRLRLDREDPSYRLFDST